MNDVPDPADRRYADDETALILRRAAELQGTAEPPTSPTLTDLQQIAGEAGIEPRYVRQAAAELAASSRSGGMVDGSTSLQLERVIPGEIPVAEFDALVEAIRAATGMAGQATVLGCGFTWTSGVPGHPRPPRAITLTVTAVDGQTTIRVAESLASVASDHLGAGVASALIGSFGAVAATGGDPSLGVRRWRGRAARWWLRAACTGAPPAAAASSWPSCCSASPTAARSLSPPPGIPNPPHRRACPDAAFASPT
jgi:hypothetical protein